MTEVEAQKVVTMLFTAFSTQAARVDADQQRDTMAIYRMGLMDLDSSVAAAGVQRVIRTKKFLPTVAEIRDACVASTYGATRGGGAAWKDVRAAVQRWGRYGRPVFDDPLVAAAVDSMGWRELCDSTNQVADRARFVDLYDHLEGNAREHAQISDGAQSLELRAPAARRSLAPRSLAGLLSAGATDNGQEDNGHG